MEKLKDLWLTMNKLNLGQMFNDASGKTSLILVSGFISLIVGLGGFFMAGNIIGIMLVFKYTKDANVISFFNTLLMQSLALITLASTMIVTDRVSKDKKTDLPDDPK